MVIARGGFPATLTYVVPTNGEHRIVWLVDIGDATWTVSCTPAPGPDADLDGVLDADDVCAGTVLPDPTLGLKPNRYAATTNGEFLDSRGDSAGVTLADTGGCSATQIIAAAGLGAGHTKHGISGGELLARVNR